MEVATAMAGGRASLSVGNTGPVILVGEVQRLLQPFQRGVDRTRQAGGYGLGLAIVQAIARAHGAALTARARPEGGLDVSVLF